MKATFRKGGVHPPQNKTASTRIELQPLPLVAVLPLSQHIGAPAQPLVNKGDTVVRGMKVAECAGNVSAAVHSPITGTVASIDNVVMPNGRPAKALIIKATEAEHEADCSARNEYMHLLDSASAHNEALNALSPEEMRRKVADCGIVGLGGATFPTPIKLITSSSKPDTLIINACECEPYLMCDDALMRRYSRQAAEGVELIKRIIGAKKAIIGIEDNKPEAIAAMRNAVVGLDAIEVVELQTKYPQGGEKQLIEAVTGRRVPSGALPSSIGVVVNNIATAFAVWQAIVLDMPLIERIITVTGDIPESERLNYMVAVGTPFADLPFTLPENAKAIIGGTMMGRTAVRLDAPVTKGTSGLVLLKAQAAKPVLACVRCGACVDACPMGLEPYLLSTFGRLRRWDDARANDVADCLECGACSYSCPSNRPLLDYIRIAKKRSHN